MRNQILEGDVLDRLRELPDEGVHCVVTSPPYWGLRDYGVAGAYGLEATPEAYVCRMVEAFREVRRVLRNDGTLWLNLGDTYVGGRRGSQGDTSTLEGSRNNQEESRKALLARESFRRDRRDVGDIRHKYVELLKPKDLAGIPWRVAFALQADGWWLRCDVIWSKPNVMPESTTDRPTRAHEYVFLLSKSERYHYDADAIREPQSRETEARYSNGFKDRYADVTDGAGYRGAYGGKTGVTLNPAGRNRRSVWEIPTESFSEAHFATFPSELVKPCILAGCPEGGIVLDPFMGAGTTALVALKAGRDFVGIEINPDYIAMAEKRIAPYRERLL